VHSFLRSMQVVDYGPRALEGVVARVVALAQAEDLPAHGEAVTARFGS
jgi:histidinol dehydrogenase